jgi:hypothetical protein
LANAQIEANKVMASNYRRIPPAAFYTAIPQLVSHLFDEGEQTTSVLKKILDRVLYKFPEQAMWHLAWLTGSKIPERSRIGNEIFVEARKVLEKTKNVDMSNLLRESGSLFQYLRDLARYAAAEIFCLLPCTSWSIFESHTDTKILTYPGKTYQR